MDAAFTLYSSLPTQLVSVDFISDMNLLFFITTAFFFISIVKSFIESAWILHTSEYRLSLLLHNVYPTKRPMYSYLLIALKIIGIIAYIPAVLDERLLLFYHYFVLFIFLLDGVICIYSLFMWRKVRINIGQREVLLFIPSIIIIWLLFKYPLVDVFFWLLLLERLSRVVYFFFAMAFSFPIELYEDMQIDQARKKYILSKKISTICVLGEQSNAIANQTTQLLLQFGLPVKSPPEPVKSTIQIVRYLQKQETAQSKIFLFQLLPYNINELVAIVEFLKPLIGITLFTGQNLQRKTILDYKKKQHALFASLRDKGMSIIGSKNTLPSGFVGAKKLVSEKNIKIILYRVDEKITAERSGIIPALLVAKYFGIPLRMIRRKVSEIYPENEEYLLQETGILKEKHVK